MADTTTIDTETLRGDVRDALLTEFRQMPKPWQQMNEQEQSHAIHRARDIADTLVRSAVDLIAERGLPALPVLVGKITIEKSACKGTFECHADDDNLLRIRHLQGNRAMFVLASPDAYAGERTEPETENVGDLAIPKTGRGAPSDPEALAKLGRGNGSQPAADLQPKSPADVSDPPFNGADAGPIPPALDRRGGKQAAVA
jgi:hypothetical protein